MAMLTKIILQKVNHLKSNLIYTIDEISWQLMLQKFIINCYALIKV